MKNVFDLSIVMPSYCESENLQWLLPQIKSVLLELNLTYEVLVVDTITSLDSTKDVCLDNNVIYVSRYPNNTYGSAVRTGISIAQGEKILFMDADGSHSPHFIKDLYNNSYNADIVIASRYIKNGQTENPWLLIIMSKFLNIIYSYILSLPCKDVSNSFKIYNSKYIKNIKLSCDNFDIVEELIYKAYKTNPNIVLLEIPYTFKKRIFGVTKRNLLMFIATYLYTIIKLRFFV